MKRSEQTLKAEIEDWFRKADLADEQEDALYGSDKRGDELPDWVKDKTKRLEKIRQAKAELEAEAKAAAQAPVDPQKTGHQSKPTGVPKTRRSETLPTRKVES